ncbi:MAG TPA: hypothetical protein PLB35_01145 [Myxococcota bacterium]|nr:hypothetical protein [Myxococcota bacterium]HOH75840.1 hypothetical protein [Myxococcota bacterium]HPV05360.1 hypothetical protein [Myxococcota bacterium]
MNSRISGWLLPVILCGCGGSGGMPDSGLPFDLPAYFDVARSDLQEDRFPDDTTGDTDVMLPDDAFAIGQADILLEGHGLDEIDYDAGTDHGSNDAFIDVTGDQGTHDSDEDAGAGDSWCTTATSCGPAATCNLSSGLCEDRSPGWTPFALLSAYPAAGAPGDMIVIDGGGFNSFTSVSVDSESLTKNSDETRIVAFRGQESSGSLKVGGATWNAPFATSTSFAGQQECTPGDPPPTAIPAANPWEPGPHAAGFADFNGGAFGVKVRVYYPATCGGLRKPPADGKFPFVYFVHGDGYIPLNFEYLARHLATWGFMSAIPDNPGYSSFNTGRTSPKTWFGALAGHETGSDAIIVCHSKGAEYTYNLGLANVAAVVFLGPVYTMEDPYGSLFPIQGLVVGWSTDGSMNTDKCYDVYQQLQAPKYAAMIIGGTHGHFLDDKMWDPPSDGSGDYITRNRQHELTQAFVLPYIQHIFKTAEPFAEILSSPGLEGEITFTSK